MIEALRRSLASPALRPALIIWLFGSVLVDIMTWLIGRMPIGINFLTSIPLIVLGVGLTLLVDALRRRLAARPRMLAWPLLVLALLTAAAVQTLADLHYLRWFALNFFPAWQDWAVISGQRLATVGILYLWTFGLILTVIWASDLGGDAARSEARAALAEAATHRAEAAALRLQLNPHFLFNAMNSIASLVTLDRKEEAEAMIDQLSDFLRASLASDPMADVTLGEEIDTIDAYLAIEAARFGERLEVEIDVPTALMDARVPNFILQPLVENAIKHGVAAATGRARIEVMAAKEDGALILQVVNRWPDSAPPVDGAVQVRKGIGLSNIRQRLAIGYSDAAALETGPLPDGWRAAIRLPHRMLATEETETEFERLHAQELTLRKQIRRFRAADRMSRNEINERRS